MHIYIYIYIYTTYYLTSTGEQSSKIRSDEEKFWVKKTQPFDVLHCVQRNRYMLGMARNSSLLLYITSNQLIY